MCLHLTLVGPRYSPPTAARISTLDSATWAGRRSPANACLVKDPHRYRCGRDDWSKAVRRHAESGSNQLVCLLKFPHPGMASVDRLALPRSLA